MEDRRRRCSRRKFLAQAAAVTFAGGLPRQAAGSDIPQEAHFRSRPPRLKTDGRKPVAVVCTVYRPLSHAYHIAGRLILGYPLDGHFHVPSAFVRAMYVDQFPDNDLSRTHSRAYGFPIARSVAEALTDKDGKLAVEGVLLIAEHGNYPRNDREQILYPRFEMMEQIVSVFRKTGRSVPVFVDKHLSYSWPKAAKMVAWSQELKFPLMAGSSLPVTWRRPELELPLQAQIEDGLVAAYGPLEVYGFHALETLQVMLERRHGGESGVGAVTCLTGNEVWKAADAGRWSWDLLEAALGRSETLNPGDVRLNTGSMNVGSMPRIPATAFLVEYRDGTRGTVLLLNGHIQDFCFAARIKGETKPASCLFRQPQPPGAKFLECLTVNIERFLESGQPPYPVDRTLLTSGTLESLLESHYQRGARIETKHLDVHYRAPLDSGFMRGNIATPV
jgi:hypothetical protein